ncbi:Programmed cell death protein 5 [Paramecium bursaria]
MNQQVDPQQMEKLQKQQEQREQMEEMKKTILAQILTPEAKQRLANVKLVKQEKVEKIEIQLCTLAQQGKLQKQITEAELIQMLEGVEAKRQETKITFKRRKFSSDDDD